MAELQGGYERAISRSTELEVDLANAISGLKRSQSDNEKLIGNQVELASSYKWLQDQHERLRQQLHKEQQDRQQLAEEQEQQVARWRKQLDDKAREYDSQQAQQPSHVELEAMRLGVIEELDGPHRQQLHELQGRLGAEVQRAAEARRQLELCRLELDNRLEEADDNLAEQAKQHEHRQTELQRKISTLEMELRAQQQATAVALQAIRGEEELEAKAGSLRQALQEHESRGDAARRASAEELSARNEELAIVRRRMHDLQADSDARERLCEQAVTEAEGLKRDKAQLLARLADAKAQLTSAKPADTENPADLRQELEHLRRSASAERQQSQRQLQGSEEQLQTTQLATRRAEARCRELEETLSEREHEFTSEREDADRVSEEALSSLRADVKRGTKEAEARRLATREREADLTRRLEAETSRADVLSDELVQCQFADKEMDERLREVRLKSQQRETATSSEFKDKLAELQVDLNATRQRAERLERERCQCATSAEAASASLKVEEERSDMLQAEASALRQHFDSERALWAREADEAHAAGVASEEERRSAAMKMLAQNHQRQLAKLEDGSKKALQKAAKRRQELKHKCQELVKRMAQLQQERATVVRVCDENRAAYELRLVELGVASCRGPATEAAAKPLPLPVPRADVPAAGEMMQRSELRGIMERLEHSAERLQASTARTSGAVVHAS